MSRREVPPISAVDLRDHADSERVQRIWERIENDLGPRPARVARRDGGRVWIALAAATLTAFAGGVWLGESDRGDDSARQLAAASDPATIDVFAAGSEARAYRLPGGGQITLEPHSVVEIAVAETTAGVEKGMLTLRLLRGAAALDTSNGRAAGLAVVAGELHLSTQAGSMLRIRRNDTDVDVSVSSGSVDITSPEGRRRLGSGEHVSGLPMFSRTASVQPQDDDETSEPDEPLTLARADTEADADADEEVDEAIREPEPVPARDWVALHYDRTSNPNEVLQAIELQYGSVANAVAAVQTDRELNALAYQDSAQTVRVLERIVNEFPSSPYAGTAAASLASHYERAGQSDLAQRYLAMVPQDRFEDDYEACNNLEAMEPDTAEAAFAASQYLARYPNGQCTDDAGVILTAAAQRVAESEGTPVSMPRDGVSMPRDDAPPEVDPASGPTAPVDDGTYDDL